MDVYNILDILKVTVFIVSFTDSLGTAVKIHTIFLNTYAPYVVRIATYSTVLYTNPFVLN